MQSPLGAWGGGFEVGVVVGGILRLWFSVGSAKLWARGRHGTLIRVVFKDWQANLVAWFRFQTSASQQQQGYPYCNKLIWPPTRVHFSGAQHPEIRSSG